jgi:hypothetical protein
MGILRSGEIVRKSQRTGGKVIEVGVIEASSSMSRE